MKAGFPLISYLLWLCGALFELVILLRIIRRRSLPGLPTLPALLAVTLATDVLCFVVPVRWYWRTFWTSQGLELFLSAAIAVQILVRVLSRHLSSIKTTSAFFALWLAWLLWSFARGNELPGMLASLSAGYFIAVLLAGAALMIPSENWPPNYAAVAFGLFIPAAAGMVLTMIQQHYGTEHFQVFRVIAQLIPFTGYAFWWSAAGISARNSPQENRQAEKICR